MNLATNTPAERAGTFPGTAAKPLWDPFTNAAYPFNVATSTYQIPQSEWDPVSVAFMQTYIPTASATTGLYTNQVANPITGDKYTIRGDYRLTKRDQMYVRFFHMVDTAVTGPPHASLISSQYYDNFSESN